MSDLIEKYSVPRVGMGVLVMRDGKCLLAKHLEKDGSFLWCMPGGHLELGESLEECARRETLEEAGVEIENIRCIVASNWPSGEARHFVRFGMVADWKSGEPRNEENIMTDWTWFPLTELPEPMLLPNETFVAAYLANKQVIGDKDFLLKEVMG